MNINKCFFDYPTYENYHYLIYDLEEFYIKKEYAIKSRWILYRDYKNIHSKYLDKEHFEVLDFYQLFFLINKIISGITGRSAII